MAVQLKHGKALSMLSLTSLIDVVFLLLIFFLVATKFAEEDRMRSLRQQLPVASEARPLTSRRKMLEIAIDNANRYYVEGRIVTLDELEEFLTQAKINNPHDQSVIFSADARSSAQALVSLMNLCKRVGIQVTEIRTADAR